MNIEDLRDFCLSLKGADEKLPFDESTLVFHIMGKMFCLTDIDRFESINLKCDPDEAIRLRSEYEEVTAGYHMNKKHWNTVRVDGNISDRQLKEWIVQSYELVVAGLPRKIKEELRQA